MLYRVNHDTTVQNFQTQKGSSSQANSQKACFECPARHTGRTSDRYCSWKWEPPLIREASPITALVDRSFVSTKAPDGENTIAVSLLVYAL